MEWPQCLFKTLFNYSCKLLLLSYSFLRDFATIPEFFVLLPLG